MLKKETLLKWIEQAMSLEERAVPLLNKHVAAALGFSGVSEEEKQAIMGKFQKIVFIKTKHVEVLKGIREEVLRGRNNVY